MKHALRNIYHLSPVLLQHIAVTLYGTWLRFLRYGSLHREMRNNLKVTEGFSRERLQIAQLRKLNYLLSEIVPSVPFYRERGFSGSPVESLEDLRDYPLTSKEDLRAPREYLTAEKSSGAIFEVHTGGTTGKPLVIYCSRPVLQRNYAFFSRFLEWTGIPPSARTCTFAGRTIVSPDCDDPPFWRYNAAMNQVLFSSYHISSSSIPLYVDALNRFDPELIDTYPSSLRPIARYIVDNGLECINPTAIVTSSETLDASTRDLIEEAFGCPVYDHYGSAEMAAFITQCSEGTYHVNPEFGIVEIIRDGKPAKPGMLGEIVATGFVNDVMPLVRYATGDLAAWGDFECPCGSAFPVIERIEGRKDDVIITPEGRLVGRLDPIFKNVDAIYETRIIQDDIDHLSVEVIPTAEFGPEHAALLKKELRRRIGSYMCVDVKTVEEIHRSNSGKLRTVVSTLSEDEKIQLRRGVSVAGQ